MRFSLNRSESGCFIPIYENILRSEAGTELVIPDVREDIAKILDVRGQVVLVSKKASADAATVSALVYAGALYLTEDGKKIEYVETEIPIDFSAAGAGIDESTEVVAELRLCGIEAKPLNPRKLLFRAEVSAKIMCFAPGNFSICGGLPDELPDTTIHLLEKQAVHSLVFALREKTFAVSDEYALPADVDVSGELVSTQTRLCIDEVKSVGSKLVFKARALTNAMFLCSGDGCKLQCGSFETVFSQIIETDSESDMAQSMVYAELLSADFVRLPQGGDSSFAATFRVNACAVCMESVVSDYVADAYSNSRPLTVVEENVQLINALQPKYIRISAESGSGIGESDICYISAASACVSVDCGTITLNVCARGTARNENGEYTAIEAMLKGEEKIVLSSGQSLDVTGVCCGGVEVLRDGTLTSDVAVCIRVSESSSINTVCTVEYDEESADCGAARPSITVLCSDTGGDDLWSVAKKYGSSVEMIEKINGTGEAFTAKKRPLLIPKTR